MPDFNTGIKTNAGIDLFNRVDSGETKIKYTKIVFSSLDLSESTDAQIEQMTDISPQELTAKPQVVLKPKNIDSDQETEIRATVNNKTLTSGFFVNTYGLFAEDDEDNKILYGIAVDSHPSYLPAYDGVRPQELTYEWDTTISDTNDIHFTDTHNAYTTQADFNDGMNNTTHNIKVVFDQAAAEIDRNRLDIKSLSSSQDKLASMYANNGNTATAAMAKANLYTDSAYSTNSRAIRVELNQLGNDDAAIRGSIKQLGSNVSDTNSLAASVNSNANNMATSNACYTDQKFHALLVAFNQVGAENAKLRKQIVG